MKVRSGSQTIFWEDVWLGDCALKTQFHNLYNFCSDTNVTMADVLRAGTCNLKFRHTLIQHELEEWENLSDILESVHLCGGRDEILWLLESKRRYSTKSLYRMMTFGGVKNPIMMEVWKCKVTLKIQIFLWMACHDRIQSAVQLRKRNWAGAKECKMCGAVETTDHILFTCPVVVFLWVFLKETLILGSVPCSIAKLELIFLSRNHRFQSVLLFIFAGALWPISKMRNDLVFEDKVIASPTVIIHKTVALLTHWKQLLDEKKMKQVETALVEINGACGSIA